MFCGKNTSDTDKFFKFVYNTFSIFSNYVILRQIFGFLPYLEVFMNSEMKTVAERLRGLRDTFEVSVETAAKVCGITPKEYMRYETGDVDIPLSVMFCMGKRYNVDPSTFITGEEPHQVSFFVTPAGKGATVNRLADYHFESLAFGYANRKADPYLVTINPGDIPEIHTTTHPGQEFNYCIEGTVRVQIGDSEVILNEGDSVYFDSSKPHGQQNLNGKRCRFITFILN